jgi:hypothetical protein
MDLTNIAIVFAPTLLLEDPAKTTPMSAMLNSSKSTHLIVGMLEHLDELF